jgi:hypothetical protein
MRTEWMALAAVLAAACTVNTQPRPAGPTYAVVGAGAAPEEEPIAAEPGEPTEPGGGAVVIGAPAPAAAAGLSPGYPVRCSGNQEEVLTGVYIHSDGVAIQASGNCDVAIVGSLIQSEGVAIMLSGNAEVHIQNSRIEGRGGAVVMSGNSEMTTASSTMRGGIRRSGMAQYADLGGTVWE